MSIRDTWRLGFVGADYTYPATPAEKEQIKGPVDHLKWHIRKTKEFGGGVVQAMLFPGTTQKDLEEIKELAQALDIELELGAGIFGLSFQNPNGSLIDSYRDEILQRLNETIKTAKFLGVKILRGSYGKLQVKYSRYNRDYPLKDHIKFIVDNLKEAKKIFEDNDLYYAQENHLDFFGTEFAEIYAAVNSKHIGCTLDTANDFCLFTNPDVGNEALAPYTITTHIKDMRVEDFQSPYGLVNFQPRGCALGDGSVDIPRILDTLEKKSPMANGLHTVIEQGWMNYDNIPEDQRDEYTRESLHKGLKFLKKELGRE
jgi:sugar phosphate isomerase/epimerase